MSKDRCGLMQARHAQAREKIHGARYSHFACSCFTFWAYDLRDMIEYECSLPYIKVSTCCVNIPFNILYIQAYRYLDR